MRIRYLAVATLVLATAVTPEVAVGQLRLTPLIGLYAPAADFGQVDNSGGAVEFGKMESTLAFGANLDIGPQAASRFRLSAVYGSRSEVPIDGVGCTNCSARAGVLLATGALLLRPVPWLGILQPYAVAGAGAKWYSFDLEGVEDLVEDQAALTGQLGVGLAIGAPSGGLRLMIEGTDNVSGFDFVGGGGGDLQHDFLVVVGLTLGG